MKKQHLPMKNRRFRFRGVFFSISIRTANGECRLIGWFINF
jgi:hypothetical protein